MSNQGITPRRGHFIDHDDGTSTFVPDTPDQLDKLLDDLLFEQSLPHNDRPYDPKGRAKVAIRQYMSDGIGKDEWNPLPKRNNYVGIRNKLRQEIRKKLGIV